MIGSKISRLIVKIYLLPLTVVKVFINKGYILLINFYKIPQKKDKHYDEMKNISPFSKILKISGKPYFRGFGVKERPTEFMRLRFNWYI